MARKSRKTHDQEEINKKIEALQKEKKTKVGGYVRLSSDQYDNDSIETQILMIRQYVKECPDFELIDIYSDEGYSGTNFVRPDFERLIRDIYAGKIDCIIVKDLSRFGRNYIEAGYYLETVLPNLGVRFISINDRFDTAREEDRYGMSLPIKNLINSMYAADISKKILKTIEMHQKLGDAKFYRATFGYYLDRENNTLIVDPVASRYVKLIFQWYLMGYSALQIAERLNMIGVTIPGVYMEQFTKIRSLSKTGKWPPTTIVNILRNPTYIGAKVHGRRKNRIADNIKQKLMEPSDWIIHYDDHEPIIDRRTFELVKEKLDAKTEYFRRGRAEIGPLRAAFKNSLSKRVVCKDCGGVMTYIRKSNGDSRSGFMSAYYTCSKRRDGLCRNTIYEDYLKAVILEQIRNLIMYYWDQKDGIKALRDGSNKKSILLANEKKLIHMKKKEADIDDLMLNLYKDLAKGVINENDYKALNARYLKEKDDAKAKIKDLNKIVFKMRRQIDAFENLGTKLAEYLNDSADSQMLIDELIEQVYVSNDGSIEIVFKCNDIIENYMYLAGENDEEYSNVPKTVAV